MIRNISEKRSLTYLLALSVTTLAVYIMALKAGFLAVDDTDTIKFIQSGKISISALFHPSGNAYYRPMAMLSLLGDFHMFGGNPAGYHLTNLLLHLANVLLVYYLSSLLPGMINVSGIYPFLAALVFAVHPVNSEAVVWISARPDLLCCFFFLLCMVLLVKGSDNVTIPVFAGLFVTLFCSLASKEASLFMPLLAMAYCVLLRDKISRKNGIAACGALVLAALAYLLLRKGLPIAPSAESATSVHRASHDSSPIIDGAAAVGYYLGKLLYPFPLNIAITEIPTTLCLGVFLLFGAAAAVLWFRPPALRFPLMFLASSLIPPLGALLLSTAWTPYAERYLYLPSVAFSLCAIMVLRDLAAGIPRPVLISIAVLAAIPTAYRVHQWTQPVSFWQDAISKSPRFGTIYLPLAAEYIERGRYDEAENALKQADELGFPRETSKEFSRELKQMIAEKRKVKLSATKCTEISVCDANPANTQTIYTD